MSRRAARRAAQARSPPRLSPTRINGGFTFAEDPEAEASDARIIWHASLDPGTLDVVAEPHRAAGPDTFDPAALAPWLAVVADGAGEHAVLSDGWHHLRLDVVAGSLGNGPVVLHYHLRGLASAQLKLLPLRRLIDLYSNHRFAAVLYPPDPRIERWIAVLRVHDALAAGATQREIGQALFDADFASNTREAESLRARVRRLVGEARALARGGYRTLLRRGRR